MTVRLFVYGTLLPGERRWPALRPFVVSWEPATAPGRLWDTGHGYPAARFEPGRSQVRGVVVTLAAATTGAAVALLDGIEDEGVLYRRVGVRTSCGPALGYEWLGITDDLVLLPDGWRGPVDDEGGTAVSAVPPSSECCSDQ